MKAIILKSIAVATLVLFAIPVTANDADTFLNVTAPSDPPELGIISKKGALELLWTADQITNTSKTPEMDIIIISETVGKDLTLPAFDPNDERSKKETLKCTFTPGIGYCVTCDDDLHIDTEASSNLSGVSILKVKTKALAAEMSNLPQGKYFVITQFSNAGTTQSACVQAYSY